VDYWYIPFFGVAVIASIYLRIINPWNSVFSWTVVLSGNDPWYYFRLVENTLRNFPNRIWFDPFTYYPYGSFLHFGPFLVYLSTIIVKISGATDPESVRSVIAFIPAIGGTLLILPVYLFTKEIINRRAAVAAAIFVVIVPGQILHRSMLGFNDHHIWEVFWMLTFLSLFVYSMNKWSGKSAKENLKNRKNLLYPILTGLALGLYLDTWAPGFIAALIILVFTFFVFVLKKYLIAETDNIVYIGSIAFLTASVIYLPFAFIYPSMSNIFYSPFQLMFLIVSAILLMVFHGFEILEERGYYSKFGLKKDYATSLVVIAFATVLLIISSVLLPSFFKALMGVIGIIHPKGGALTIAEVQPFFSRGGEFDLLPAWVNFGMTFFYAIPGLLYVAYLVISKRHSSYLLMLIFSVSMLVALSGQNRFAYYFGAVSAILAGTFLELLLRTYSTYIVERKTGRMYTAAFLWLIAALFVSQDVYKMLPFFIILVIIPVFIDVVVSLRSTEKQKMGLKDVVDAINKHGSSVTVVVAIFILVMPALAAGYTTFKNAEMQSKAGGGLNKKWWDALVWMRENTPDPGLDYYELYKPGKTGEKYPYYPDSAYGVMSWWDYGHWITAISHRIPNANPFQAGIGSKNGAAGAAPFFTAFSEKEANRIADELGVKYVVSDVEMATGKFYAMATWAEGSLDKAGTIYYVGPAYFYMTPEGIGITPYRAEIPPNAQVITINLPSENYYRTMEARFHIFDGNGLKNYRMIYESGYESKNMITMEIVYKLAYMLFYKNSLGIPEPELISTGYVKVFEYVKGAKITGNTTAEKVFLNLTLKSNQGRLINYQQEAEVIDGTYEFVVPYAQDTQFAVKPVTPYRLTAGNASVEVNLTEEDVRNGNIIYVNLY